MSDIVPTSMKNPLFYKNMLTSSGDENIVVVEKVSENNNYIIKNVVLES